MSNLHVFPFNSSAKLRSVELEGEPWFLAIDVIRCLGLNCDNGTGQHYKKLRPSEKRKVAPIAVGRTSGGRHMLVLSESGLYKLIMRSNKPEAMVFQDWVTKTVLPAIRKHGGYLLNEDARKDALADSREEMPTPSAFSDLLKRQSDQIDRLLAIVERLAA